MIKSIRNLLSQSQSKSHSGSNKKLIASSKFFSTKKDGDNNDPSSNKIFVKYRFPSKVGKKQTKTSNDTDAEKTSNIFDKNSSKPPGPKKNLNFFKNWAVKSDKDKEDSKHSINNLSINTIHREIKLSKETPIKNKESPVEKEPIVIKKPYNKELDKEKDKEKDKETDGTTIINLSKEGDSKNKIKNSFVLKKFVGQR